MNPAIWNTIYNNGITGTFSEQNIIIKGLVGLVCVLLLIFILKSLFDN